MQRYRKINYLDFSKEFSLHRKEYLSAVERVFKSGVYILSNEVTEFEKEFANYLGVKCCVGVGNGLEAIQISLMALGIKKGDEVITTPLSAVATTLAILAVGATPVFVDIDENGQINADLIESAITNKTKAVLPVDLYGQPANLVRIKDICRKNKLFLVEDACQAHGSTFKGKRLGTYGDVGCFSFYPTKNLGAIGDGGAIVTEDPDLAEIFREIRDYGQKSKYVHVRFGLNSRLDELQAAILREKLKYLDKYNEKRRDIAKKYVEKLKDIRDLKMVLPRKIDDSNFHLFVVRTKQRDKLQSFLKENGVPSLVHYPIAIPDQPMFKGKYKGLEIPVARKFVDEVLSLPCHPFMDSNDINYISAKISNFV